MRIPHDSLYKELLTTFFWEFLELFDPELLPSLDRESLIFLEKETLADLSAGRTHVVDLLAQVRFRGGQTTILVHVENQARPEPGFARRMFAYYARLHQRHVQNVYPIAVFSYRAGRRRPEPDRYKVEFPHRRVLDFHFHTIELSRLDWRDFVNRENPVASALMSQMAFSKAERAKVKGACLRTLAGLPLDSARLRLLSTFIDIYLNLDEKETQELQQEISQWKPAEQEAILEYTTSWKREGIAQGREEAIQELSTSWKREGLAQGLAQGLARALQARFGDAGQPLVARLPTASLQQLERLDGQILTANLHELGQLLEP